MTVIGVDVPGKKIGAFAVYNTVINALLDSGDITFGSPHGEATDYQAMWHTLERRRRKYNADLIVIEHPFLHVIAQNVGAVKMWAAMAAIPYYMITASSARKTVLGSANAPAGTEKKDRAKANKLLVIQHMARRFGRSLTQHQADAALYAVAGSRLYGNART